MPNLIKRLFHQTTRSNYPRYSLFTNRYEDLATLPPATLERAEQAKIRKSEPQRFIQQYHSTVVQTDGSTYTIRLSVPLQPRIVQVKDTVHHPLWNSRIRESAIESNSEEFLKFKRKFVGAGGVDQGGIGEDDLASLAVDENGADPFVIRREIKTPQASSQKGKKKK